MPVCVLPVEIPASSVMRAMPKSTTFTKFFLPFMVIRYVVGLEVAMDDPAFVRGLESVADLEQDRSRDVQGNGNVVPEQRLQRAAVQELHHEVLPVTLGDVQVEDLEDVVVPDDVDRARLVEEAIDDLLVVRKLRVQELDRHPRSDPGVHAHVDAPHAALAEEFLHPSSCRR